MRFKARLELEHGLKQIALVPLINVVLLLLVFLMLTSSFMTQPGIKVNLPKVFTSEAVRKESIEILLTTENLTYFNNRIINTSDLTTLFKQAAARKQAVVIKADKNASLGKAVELWDMARSLGIAQINIATNQ